MGARVLTASKAAGAHDAGFLPANALAVIAQEFHVIQVNTGDHGAISINDVDRVKTATQANFENGRVWEYWGSDGWVVMQS